MKHPGILLLLLLLLSYFSCQVPTERLEHFQVHGIDISHYQASIDWDQIAQQEVHFAFVKASEGQDLHDSLFCGNWSELKRVGIKRGAYHFFRPSIPAALQVQNFREQVDLTKGDLPPVLDVEVTGGLDKAAIVQAVQSWLWQVEFHYGVQPIIYSNYNFYRDYLMDDLGHYPVWIARYSTRTPQLPSGQPWQFWQYGNRGELAGIEGPVDFNVFRGTLAELEALGIDYVPPTLLSDRH